MVELHGAHLVSHERPDEVNIVIVNFSMGHLNNYTFHLKLHFAVCCISVTLCYFNNNLSLSIILILSSLITVSMSLHSDSELQQL